MLDGFHAAIGERMTVPAARGLTFYQVLSLASMVNREAVLDVDRPLIAGVFQNRMNPKLFGNLHLGSDPTVFYVHDTIKLAADGHHRRGRTTCSGRRCPRATSCRPSCRTTSPATTPTPTRA